MEKSANGDACNLVYSSINPLDISVVLCAIIPLI